MRRISLALVPLSLGTLLFAQPAGAPVCGWLNMMTPNVASAYDFPSSISSTSPNNAWYVGQWQDNANRYDHTLSAHWNGTSWKLVKTPNPGYHAWLNSVAALANGTAWAVGVSEDTSFNQHPLLMFWNGSKWTVMKGPSGATAGSLNDVVALSSANVWAVGSAGTNGLIEHWNGHAWSLVKHPHPGTTSTGFTSVTQIPGTNQIWVGGEYQGPPTQQPVAMKWTGKKWKTYLVASGAPQAQFNDITAISKTDAWAVGYQTGEPNTWGTFTAWFDGTTWTVIASPHPSTGFPGEFLYGVAALSPTNVYAVGSSYNSTNSSDDPLMLHWDGISWTQVPIAEAGTQGFDLNDVARVPGKSHPLAVGYEYTGGTEVSRVVTYC